MLVATSVRESASTLLSLWKNHIALEEGKIKFQIWTQQKRDLKPGPVPGPSCTWMRIMLVLVLSFLPSLYCDLGSVYYSAYETVIPKSLTVEGGGAPGEKASYVILMQGQKQLIHLRVKRDYFVNNFPVFSYHKGIVRQDAPFLPHDCHYEGYIEGVPGSFVSVNTCSGLRGILIKEAKSYIIEPMRSSKQFEHVLYAMAPQAPASCRVASSDRQTVSSSWQQGNGTPGSPQELSLWSHTKYVEMVIVVNNQRFQMWGSNVTETVQRVGDIIALANSFTRGINTQVVLAGIEIWTEGDLVEIPGDLQVTLRNFNSWRQEQLLHRMKHDVAHMIVGQHPEEGTGQAFLSGACSKDFAAAVESFHHEDVHLFAALMVHELGHNLGIQHDHSACVCEGRPFGLMHENISKEGGFSNCSSDYFYHFLREHRGACLFNNPRHRGRWRRHSYCGNGVVEDTEQCDCGSACYSDPCCDHMCRLREGAECSDGLCCFNCRLRYEGFMCRPAVGECDLPEYCNGSSRECPTDSYKQDGTSCDRIHFCTAGRCKNPDNQCMDIFGSPARSAPDACYVLTNSRGDRFGNCGRPTLATSRYVKCFDDNTFCGKVICTNIKQIPSIKPHHTLIQIPFEDDYCWSMDAFYITDVPDNGDTYSGTLCAPNKVCMSSSCTDYAVLNYDCKPEQMCNGKGVCNNLRHCHCDYGYAPPLCRSPGNGGSVDSGPPGKPTDENGSDSSAKHIDEAPYFNVLILIFPSFLLLLLLLIIFFISLSAGIESAELPEDTSEETSEETKTMSETPLPTESQKEVAVTEGVPPEGGPPEEVPPERVPSEGVSLKGAPSVEGASSPEHAPSSEGIPSPEGSLSSEMAPAEPES